MTRKWTTLGACLAATLLAVAGLSLAEDEKEKSALEGIMEKVGSKNGAIAKAVRTAPAWAKGSKKAKDDADELVKLFKEAKEIKDAAEKQKKPYEDWVKLNDEQIKVLEDFAEIAGKPGKQDEAKTSFESVKKVCADCHKVFRVEDE